MKCLSSILLAAAALVGCLATAINAAPPQDLLVPFNDLLPPLLDVDGTVNTKAAAAATTATASVVRPALAEARTKTIKAAAAPTKKATVHVQASPTKPTKKPYYQQKHHNEPYTTPATVKRGPKKGLPTLTPFPRHLKK